MFDPNEIRDQFPILSRTVYGKPLVYLDSAATAQKPRCVVEAMDRFTFSSNSNIHRGIHHLSVEATARYEEARTKVAEFINAPSVNCVVFTAGATAAINTVAYGYGLKNFRRGDNIIVSKLEHHSNIVPWQMVCRMTGTVIRVIPFDESGRLMVEKLPGLIDERTRMVAVTQMSNVLGTCPDLDEIIKVAHKHNVPVLVDGCQGIVHRRVDVGRMDCDFYVFSGHKLFGPTGIGVLYGKESLLQEMNPFMGGGDMVSSVSFEGPVFAPIPLKFEAGTANFIGAAGLAEAIDFVLSLDIAGAEEHIRRMAELTINELSAIDGLRTYGERQGKGGIISFSVEGAPAMDIGMILDKMGIAVRTGMHCAEPVLQHYGQTSMTRASFAVYNTVEEAEKLVAGVRRAVGMLRG